MDANSTNNIHMRAIAATPNHAEAISTVNLSGEGVEDATELPIRVKVTCRLSRRHIEIE